MELSGDLSDFALTDILQILALSRKTGTLSLEAGALSGKIIIEQGRITYASVEPGMTLADLLVFENRIGEAALEELRSIGLRGGGVWDLETLLTESGIISREELEVYGKRHIQMTVGVLVGLEKGRFGIDLNYAALPESFSNMKLRSGVDVGEALLEAAKEKDESGRHGKEDEEQSAAVLSLLESDNDRSLAFSYDPAAVGYSRDGRESVSYEKGVSYESSSLGSQLAGGVGASNQVKSKQNGFHANGNNHHRSGLLLSLLAELRSHSFEAEVSLLIMRYASEVVPRGILFVVKGQEVCGLGQFGVDSGADGVSPDEVVRQIRIPIGGKSIFDSVVITGEPFIGALPEGYWNMEMLGRIGGVGLPISAFALPLVCQDRAIFVFYGDNYPSLAEMSGLDELVALVSQSSVVLEKIVLERRLMELQERNR